MATTAGHKVWDVVINYMWDETAPYYDSDVALVVLESELDLNDQKVGIVCLPPFIEATSKDLLQNGFVVGWGISEKSEALNPTPVEVEIPSATFRQCNKADAWFFHASSHQTFFTGFTTQNESACSSDDGGGLLVNDPIKEKIYLTGIYSASLMDSSNECRSDTCSIFANVGKLVEWIAEKIRETTEIKWNGVNFKCSRPNEKG